MSRSSFPPPVPWLRHPLPSTGSLGSVPPLQRYYAVLRLPAAHSVSLRCLRSTVAKSPPVSLPRRAEPARRGLGLVTRCPSGFTSEASGPPRFLDVPVAHMLRSWTPVESQRPGLLGRAMRPSAVVTACASTSTNSRGSLTQPARSLCTLRSAGCPYTTQHSVPAGGQPLPSGIRDPPGRTEGFDSPWSAPSPLSRLGPAPHNSRLYLPTRPPRALHDRCCAPAHPSCLKRLRCPHPPDRPWPLPTGLRSAAHHTEPAATAPPATSGAAGRRPPSARRPPSHRSVPSRRLPLLRQRPAGKSHPASPMPPRISHRALHPQPFPLNRRLVYHDFPPLIAHKLPYDVSFSTAHPRPDPSSMKATPFRPNLIYINDSHSRLRGKIPAFSCCPSVTPVAPTPMTVRHRNAQTPSTPHPRFRAHPHLL